MLILFYFFFIIEENNYLTGENNRLKQQTCFYHGQMESMTKATRQKTHTQHDNNKLTSES